MPNACIALFWDVICGVNDIVLFSLDNCYF